LFIIIEADNEITPFVDLGFFSAERVMASPKIDIAVKKYFIKASVT
jgi:hypothetical protein